MAALLSASLITCGLLHPAQAARPAPSASGTLKGAAGEELMFHPADGTAPVPLRTMNRLRFPLRPFVAEARSPQRRFELVTGDVLSGELLQIDESTVTARLSGRAIELPRAHIRRIATSGPYADVLADDFSAPGSAWQPVPDASLFARPPGASGSARLPRPQLNLPASGLSITRSLPQPLRTFRVAVDLVQPPGVARTAAGRSRNTRMPEWGVELHFLPDRQPHTADAEPAPGDSQTGSGGPPGTQLRVVCQQAAGLYGVEIRSSGRSLLRKELLQPIRPRAGPVRLTFLRREQSLTVMLDDLLLAQLNPATDSDLRLRGITLYRDAAAAMSDPPADRTTDKPPAVRGLVVQRCLQQVPPARLTLSGSSGVILVSGAELYGDLSFVEPAPAGKEGAVPSDRKPAASGSFLQLKNPAGTFRMGWRQLHGIQWQREADRPAPARPATGVCCRLLFQPVADLPGAAPDQLTAVLTGTRQQNIGTVLQLQHGLLGRLNVPLSRIREIRPLFSGTRILLAAGPYHLGESPRSEFQQLEPYGTRLAGGFQLRERPTGPAYLRLSQCGVEAAGPEAPPGSPFLRELRRGGLITEVLMNNQSVGTINGQLRFRSRAGEPQDVRIEVPAELLRVGLNRWQIRQQPDSRNRTSYDDCEIGPVFLELEAAPVPSAARGSSGEAP